jgi:hypothetical protein
LNNKASLKNIVFRVYTSVWIIIQKPMLTMKAGRGEPNTHTETVPCGREHSCKLECPSFTNNKVIRVM